MKKSVRILTIVLFFGFMITMSLITVFAPKKSFSELENKSLAKFPEFNWEDVKSKEFMSDIDTFVSDHFAFRTSWITLKTNIDLVIGKDEINGVYITDDMLLSKFQKPNYETVEATTKAINAFAKNNDLPVFVMIVPTAIDIYKDKLNENIPLINQKEFIDDIYKTLTQENIVTLDAYTSLNTVKNDYIYYRTDHHWTSLGAYYAYAGTIEKMGFKPVSINDFNVEHASNDFYGTTFSKVLYYGLKPDVIDFYTHFDGSKVTSLEVANGLEPKVYDSLYFREFLDKKDKYSAFTGSNMPLISVKTNVENGKKLLVIKDSYAHCYMQFLAGHYSEIDMLDLRYLMNYADQQTNMDEYDQVLILYNADTISTDTNFSKLTKNK